MGNLVTSREIVVRYEAGEKAFDLALEKWVKIRESLETSHTPLDYREILAAAMVKVPLCLECRDNRALCPLKATCSRGEEPF